jgi:predicted ArsR family transcriptional regulator
MRPIPLRTSPPLGEGKTRRAIVKLLKTEGPADSARLARRLRLTPMAVRQHLYALQREHLVTAEERPVPLGRPAKFWQLTNDADRLFPDAYAELSVALIDAMDQALGPAGVQRVLASRSEKQRKDYLARIPQSWPLERKLQELARIRTEEGYMAEVQGGEEGSFLFIENHCPICAAATVCQGLCSTELDLFRTIFGEHVSVERATHIVSGDRRCAYRVSPVDGQRRTERASPRRVARARR